MWGLGWKAPVSCVCKTCACVHACIRACDIQLFAEVYRAVIDEASIGSTQQLEGHNTVNCRSVVDVDLCVGSILMSVNEKSCLWPYSP
jgi:hypothetical protein